MREIYAVLTLAYRDLLKLLRDPTRLISELMFPLLFIVVLGGSLQGTFGTGSSFDYITYVFTGVFAQTLFQSASMGVVSLIDDRENDFSQEVFVSPISRYTIILGKILGETLVAMTQALGILVFGFLAGVRFLFWAVDRFGLVRHSDLFIRRSFWSDHTLKPEQPADRRSSFSLYHVTAILFGWCV